MKKHLTILAFIAFSLCSFLEVNGQNYSSALGARVGYPLSASYKKFVSGNNAVELYAGYRGWKYYNWFSVNGAYQIHNNLEGLDGLQWYYGAGAGVYFWNYDRRFGGDTSANTTFSLQGYLGLDFTLKEAPINFTLDWVPTVFFNGYSKGFGPGYGNLGIRYVLAR